MTLTTSGGTSILVSVLPPSSIISWPACPLLQRARDVGDGSDPILHVAEVPAVANNDHFALGNHHDELPLVPARGKIVAELVVAVGPPPVSIRRRRAVRDLQPIVALVAQSTRFAHPACRENARAVPLTFVQVERT